MAADMEGVTGATLSDRTSTGNFKKWYTLNTGDTMTFTLSGDSIGMYRQPDSCTGNLVWNVDGGVEQSLELGTKQIVKFGEGLGDGEHTVTVTNNTNSPVRMIATYTWDAQ